MQKLLVKMSILNKFLSIKTALHFSIALLSGVILTETYIYSNYSDVNFQTSWISKMKDQRSILSLITFINFFIGFYEIGNLTEFQLGSLISLYTVCFIRFLYLSS